MFNTKKIYFRASLLSLFLTLSIFLIGNHVDAATMYRVKNDYRPTSGGKGIWIANDANGYYSGRAFPNDLIQSVHEQQSCQDNDPNKCEMWVYGLVKSDSPNGRKRKKPIYTTGWLKKADLYKSNDAKFTTDRYIQGQKTSTSNRSSLGGSWNCPPHECIGGKTVRLQQCYGAYFYNAVIDSKGKLRPYDKAGTAKAGAMFDYRFTTAYPTPQGGYYAVGRLHSKKAGWVLIDDKCIPAGQARSGGPKFKF